MKSENYQFEDQGYFYKEVIDKRVSKYFLGQLFDRSGAKVDLVLSDGTEKAFLNQTLPNFNRATSNIPLIVEIDHLSFVEKRGRGGLIQGDANINISVYSVYDNDTSLMCEAHSSAKYERSLITLRESSYEPLLRDLWVACMEYTDDYIKLNKSRIEAFNTGVNIIIKPFESKNRGDTIHYLSRAVTWSDFKAEPRNGSRYAAAIFPTIALGTHLTIRDGKLTAILQPQVFVLKNQSWAKNNSKTPSGLKHEQLHFDITKVVMNRLLKKLKYIEAKTMDDLSSIIQYEYLEAFREMNHIQDEYDSETNHNLNRSKQAEWERKVAGWLEES